MSPNFSSPPTFSTSYSVEKIVAVGELRDKRYKDTMKQELRRKLIDQIEEIGAISYTEDAEGYYTAICAGVYVCVKNEAICAV